MGTKKAKIIYVRDLPYVVENRVPVIGDQVVEELMTGIFDLFEIHTLNDIDVKTQWPILAKPEDIKYHWISGQVMHDHIYDFFEEGTIEEIYDKVNTLKNVTDCEILMEGCKNNDCKLERKYPNSNNSLACDTECYYPVIKRISGKIVLKYNG